MLSVTKSDFLFLFGLGHYFSGQLIVRSQLSKFAPILEEIDSPGSRQILGIEGVEAKECFGIHIGAEPIDLRLLLQIPKAFLPHPNAFDRMHKAKKGSLAKCPNHS